MGSKKTKTVAEFDRQEMLKNYCLLSNSTIQKDLTVHMKYHDIPPIVLQLK